MVSPEERKPGQRPLTHQKSVLKSSAKAHHSIFHPEFRRQSYAYDGFGNLTTQTVTTGSAPSLSVTYDPATNRQTGECADANGNLNSAPTCWNQAMYYDVENRPVKNSGYLAWAYSYAPGNKRVWRGVWDTNNTQTVDEVTFWGVNGQKLTTYSLSMYYNQFVATSTGSNYYFGGKLIKNATGYVGADRLGSIGKYFPYGQERPSATTDGKEKFATYFRDSETGLDYANARYHQPGMGRFMTADSAPSAGGGDPGSWNRYAYTRGDPVNRADPGGTADCDPNTCITVSANVDTVEYITISLTQSVGSWWANQAAAAIAAAQSAAGAYARSSGTGYRPPGTPQASPTMLTNALGSVLGAGTNCNTAITAAFGTGGGSIGDMTSHVSDVTFWDVTTPYVGDLSIASVVSNAVPGQGTFNDLVSDAYAAVVLIATPSGKQPGTDLVIGATFYGDFTYAGGLALYKPTEQAYKNDILTHEMLHIYTGKNDVDLARALGLTLGLGADASTAITDYLKSDCKTTSF